MSFDQNPTFCKTLVLIALMCTSVVGCRNVDAPDEPYIFDDPSQTPPDKTQSSDPVQTLANLVVTLIPMMAEAVEQADAIIGVPGNDLTLWPSGNTNIDFSRDIGGGLGTTSGRIERTQIDDLPRHTLDLQVTWEKLNIRHGEAFISSTGSHSVNGSIAYQYNDLGAPLVGALTLEGSFTTDVVEATYKATIEFLDDGLTLSGTLNENSFSTPLTVTNRNAPVTDNDTNNNPDPGTDTTKTITVFCSELNDDQSCTNSVGNDYDQLCNGTFLPDANDPECSADQYAARCIVNEEQGNEEHVYYPSTITATGKTTCVNASGQWEDL